MSTLVVLKERNTLVLGTDSRFMKADDSGIASDSGVKVFDIAEQTFIAASGWMFGCDFERAKARELANKLAMPDIREIGAALRREFVPYLEDLAKTSTSVEGLHTYGGSAVCGNVPIHASVLVGRDARGELGYLTQEYTLREGGRIAIELNEYFGDERRVWARPGEPVMPIAQDRRTWTDNPVEVVRRFLTTLKAANPRIGGPDQIIKLDSHGAHWITQLPASAVSVAGDTHASIDVGGGGFTFSGNGGISLTNGGNLVVTPGRILCSTAIAYTGIEGAVGGGFWYRSEPGLYGTRTVKDGSGNNKTVYIKGGIIVAWDL